VEAPSDTLPDVQVHEEPPGFVAVPEHELNVEDAHAHVPELPAKAESAAPQGEPSAELRECTCLTQTPRLRRDGSDIDESTGCEVETGNEMITIDMKVYRGT
jgi:hypothetical protein